MLRTRDIVDRSVVRVPVPVVNLAATTRKDVLPDSTGKVKDVNDPIALNSYEIAYIQIFNGAALGSGLNLYYALGVDCDNLMNFAGYIQPGNFVNIYTRERVNCFNPGANPIPVSITVLVRQDLVTSN